MAKGIREKNQAGSSAGTWYFYTPLRRTNVLTGKTGTEKIRSVVRQHMFKEAKSK